MATEVLYLFIIIVLPLAIVLTYFLMKANSVSRKIFEETKAQLNESQNELNTTKTREEELRRYYEKSETEKAQLQNRNREQESLIAELNATIKSMGQTQQDLKDVVTNRDGKLEEQNHIITKLTSANATFDATNQSLKEKLDTQKKEIEDLSKKSLMEFESLANKIFDEKTTHFSKATKENMDQILNPLKENLKDFKQRVEDTYDKESKQRFSLESKIKELVELNQQISRDATNLTRALKGQAKTQGDWGEMILVSILEHSGLVKDREYFTQESYRDNNGKLKQPDVTIKYPGNRHIIVDSKVSLTAYERFSNCEDLSVQKQHLKDHIKSIRTHIDNLSSKEYDKIDKSLDFVMLFIPVEPAFMTAIQYDQELWSYAYKKRILLISPTNLIAALKMVADIWKREHQNANAVEIARRGELLYEKFVGFVTDMEDIDKALSKASEKYNDAFGKLSKGRGNLIGQAESLKNMGLNPKKIIPAEYLTDNIGIEQPGSSEN